MDMDHPRARQREAKQKRGLAWRDQCGDGDTYIITSPKPPSSPLGPCTPHAATARPPSKSHPFPTSLPLVLVVNPRGQRCTAHAHPLSVAAKACVRACVTRQARREREQIIRHPCNGSCQADGGTVCLVRSNASSSQQAGSRSSDRSHRLQLRL